MREVAEAARMAFFLLILTLLRVALLRLLPFAPSFWTRCPVAYCTVVSGHLWMGPMNAELNQPLSFCELIISPHPHADRTAYSKKKKFYEILSNFRPRIHFVQMHALQLRNQIVEGNPASSLESA